MLKKETHYYVSDGTFGWFTLILNNWWVKKEFLLNKLETQCIFYLF